jgi:hypothetical protein
MEVETYECSETAAEPIEACEEAVGIITALELQGQQTLLTPTDEDESPKRVPYREATAEEAFVFGVICPQKTRLDAYDLGPIPLRVLQIAAHATNLGFYRRLEVWHTPKMAEPDPVLVGMAPAGEYDWQVKPHLLARWGEVLESWPVLVKRAIERKRAQVVEICQSLLARLQAVTGRELTAEELMAKGADWKPDVIGLN